MLVQSFMQGEAGDWRAGTLCCRHALHYVSLLLCPTSSAAASLRSLSPSSALLWVSPAADGDTLLEQVTSTLNRPRYDNTCQEAAPIDCLISVTPPKI